ncbi:MAG: condensation domain-containing protein, partial [Cyanobacteria bacterium J06607_6]
MTNLFHKLSTLSPEQRALFEQKLAERGLRSPQATSIAPRANPEQAPLSFAQQRLWFVQQLEPDNTAYNVASVLRLQGDLNVSVLEQTLNALIERHETLRTRFGTTTDNQPIQVVSPFQPVELPMIDLRRPQNGGLDQATAKSDESQPDLSSANPNPNGKIQHLQTPLKPGTHGHPPTPNTGGFRGPASSHSDPEDAVASTHPENMAQDWTAALTEQPFDLTQPLLRPALLQLDEQEHLLVLTTHHIISDRWSVMVFLREMTVLYDAFRQGHASPLPPLPIQYGDWAVWQQQQLQGERLETQLAYWQAQLGGELPVLELPTDRPQPAVPTYQGAQYPLTLSAELSAALKTLSSQSNT